MLDLILDTEINPVLLSSFVGALSLFGKDNLGKIEEINIKGLDVDMIIVYKYNLILIAILSQGVTTMSYLRDEVEKALDMFYSSYVEELKNLEFLDVSIFDEFRKVLYIQIEDYLQVLKDKEKEDTIQDFGFFTEAIRKLRNGT